ncbi:MAG: adenylyltransferase/cytidyltransferase family protein [Candidatus Marsarchaeota archaeon]|nr:adenylyltransferase/cytidyltransferase family protein [Candidatus Marsarchaeota archaeon]MCL5112475.1 adenylyltransferase/cytidyltransferase family protein [Candidatus Marsarchaeota archaeon]
MRKVFCWGTFDILHKGHLEFLRDAKRHGDYLAVIIITDAACYENKGRFPKHTQAERAKALEGTPIVDEVILASGDLESDIKRYASMHPNAFVFGYDQQTQIEERIKACFKKSGLRTRFYTSKEFAGGLHTRNLI